MSTKVKSSTAVSSEQTTIANYIDSLVSDIEETTYSYAIACDQRDAYMELYDEELQKTKTLEGTLKITPRDKTHISSKQTVDCVLGNLKRHPALLAKLQQKSTGHLYLT